jgi:hypothetical protein
LGRKRIVMATGQDVGTEPRHVTPREVIDRTLRLAEQVLEEQKALRVLLERVLYAMDELNAPDWRETVRARVRELQEESTDNGA